MGDRNIIFVACAVLLITYSGLHAPASLSAEIATDTFNTVAGTAKLKEEINLVGATLKEIIDTDANLSGLKQVNLKTYQTPITLSESDMESVAREYRDRLKGKDWQMILYGMAKGRIALIYGQEKEGIREKLLIVLITPSEISEMVLTGEIELQALGELRKAIIGSIPKLSKMQAIEDFFGSDYREITPTQDYELWFRKAQQEPPEDPMDKARRLLYTSEEYEKALRLYEEMVNSDSTNAQTAQLIIGIIYGHMNQTENEIEAFEKAVEKYPSALSHMYLGRAYQKTGMYEKAFEQYKVIMSEYPGSSEYAEAQFNAGRCAEKLGNLDEAKSYYKTLAEKLEGDDRFGVMAEKELIRIERGGSLPFLGLGFNFTSSMEGAPIATVFKNGPCNNAGIKRGDVLIAIGSELTPNARSVIKIIGWKKNIGDEVRLLIRRKGRREVTQTQIISMHGQDVEIPVKYGFTEEEIEIPVVLSKMPDKLER